MSTAAIICELNPLHNGHLLLIDKAKKRGDNVVLIMSGNFTQRAGSAVYHKYARAKTAVQCGADLVLELPFPYSSSGAEFFAHSGVVIAEKAGADLIMFGSETGDTAFLKTIAEVTDSEEYARLFADLSKNNPSDGAAQLRQKALCSLIPNYPEDRQKMPNDVLATQYIRFAHAECEAVKRIETASASEIRRIGKDKAKDFIPDYTYQMMSDTPASHNALLRSFLWQYLRMNRLSDKIAECNGGLGERLSCVARQSVSPDDFFEKSKTKKYTNSRILRAALFASLGVTDTDVRTMPLFTAVLASNKTGCKILSDMKHQNDFSVITKPSSYKSLLGTSEALDRQLHLWKTGDELYTMLLSPAYPSEFFLAQTPYII